MYICICRYICMYMSRHISKEYALTFFNTTSFLGLPGSILFIHPGLPEQAREGEEGIWRPQTSPVTTNENLSTALSSIAPLQWGPSLKSFKCDYPTSMQEVNSCMVSREGFTACLHLPQCDGQQDRLQSMQRWGRLSMW